MHSFFHSFHSFFFTSLYRLLQCSVLGPLLFIMYTTSSFQLSPKIMTFAQFFFSCHPCNFDSRVTRLQNALEHICPWMTADLLTLNSSKTKFLLVRLKQQLAKIQFTTAQSTPLTLPPPLFILTLITLTYCIVMSSKFSIKLSSASLTHAVVEAPNLSPVRSP